MSDREPEEDIDELLNALDAIVEAGEFNNNSRVQYMVAIAQSALNRYYDEEGED